MSPRHRVIGDSPAGASPGAPAISVVIPTHRPAERLAPTLDALAQQTLGADRFDVIVVLDGPDRGRADTLRDATHRFRFDVLPSPGVGRAAACNAGVAFAHGDIVLLLDDDMALAADALAAHVARHATDRRLGVIGAVPVRVPPRAPFATRYVARRFGRHLAKLGRPGYPIDVRDVYMGAFSIERATFAAVGGFDDRFVEYGNEDGDLAGRLLAAGVELVYAPEAIAHQAYDKSFAALATDHVAKGRTAVRFLRLHPERAAESPLHRRGRGSWRRRLVRSTLQRIIAVPRGRDTLLAATERAAGTIQRLNPALADRLAAAVLDACFWSGVRAATREAAQPAEGRRTVIHYTDAAKMGGAERIALSLLTGLDRSRWRPVLVAHANPGIVTMLDEARAAGIEVRVVALMRGPGGLLGGPRPRAHLPSSATGHHPRASILGAVRQRRHRGGNPMRLSRPGRHRTPVPADHASTSDLGATAPRPVRGSHRRRLRGHRRGTDGSIPHASRPARGHPERRRATAGTRRVGRADLAPHAARGSRGEDRSCGRPARDPEGPRDAHRGHARRAGSRRGLRW